MQLYPGDVKTFYAMASKLRLNAYFNLRIDLQAWRTWLATQVLILTRLDVDQTWDNATRTDLQGPCHGGVGSPWAAYSDRTPGSRHGETLSIRVLGSGSNSRSRTLQPLRRG